MTDAFDADCLIYAAIDDHPLGVKVAALFADAAPGGLTGSTFLIPELLAKPIREKHQEEVRRLGFYLARLALCPVDQQVAAVAAGLGARYRLRAADAVHLACAVTVGADRLITNNRRDFGRYPIVELEVTYPDQL